MQPEKPIRVCKYSKLEYVPKRSNQIFFDKKCRTAYHNSINNSIRKKLSKINNQLINNYKILVSIMLGKSEASFHPEYLRGAGFSFSVHTHVEQYKDVFTYAVYEFIIKSNEDGTYLIKRV